MGKILGLPVSARSNTCCVRTACVMRGMSVVRRLTATAHNPIPKQPPTTLIPCGVALTPLSTLHCPSAARVTRGAQVPPTPNNNNNKSVFAGRGVGLGWAVGCWWEAGRQTQSLAIGSLMGLRLVCARVKNGGWMDGWMDYYGHGD